MLNRCTADSFIDLNEKYKTADSFIDLNEKYKTVTEMKLNNSTPTLKQLNI